MKTAMLKALFLAVILAFSSVPAQATTCFYTGEQISGYNKICWYDCLGSAAAVTITIISLCPLTIAR